VPYHKNIARSLIKAPKVYFYDIARVSDKGARLENLVACALLKETEFRSDCYGEEFKLYYLRDRDQREVNFFLKGEEKNVLIEVKASDKEASGNFVHFVKYFK
jgi:uncharacterized protein